MKRVYIIITAIITLSLILSCEKESGEFSINEKGTKINFTGVFGTETTKTSLGTPSSTHIPVLWKVGDHLGLYLSDFNSMITSNVVALLDKEIGVGRGPGFSKGSFNSVVGALEPSTQYFMKLYYPYYERAGSGSYAIEHSIPSIQTQSKASNSEHIGKSGAFGYSTLSFTTPSSLLNYNPSFDFTLDHKTSFVWFYLTAQEGSGGFEGWRVKSISLTTPEERWIAGETSFNTTTHELSVLGGALDKKYNKVSLNITTGITLSSTEAESAYMVVAPISLVGQTVKIDYLLESADGSESRIVSHNRTLSSSSEAFKSGEVHRFTEVIPVNEGGSWSFSNSAEPIDLSFSGTSNSYIVSHPGDYSFDATVIGNGEAGLLGLPTSTTQFHTDNPAISPTSVELVWQSAPSLIADLSLSDGRVYFTKGDETKGNALIAVKDSGGDILWSWHIWCTDVGEPQTYINDVGYSFEVMDRNLGATIGLDRVPTTSQEEIASIGLSYQFGRKDPFIGINALSTTATLSTTYDIDGNIYGWPATELTSPAVGTIENSIQNPTLFISSEAKTPYDWFVGKGSGGGIDVRGFYLWGNPYGFWHGTEGGSSPNNPRTPQKSIYDPCPVGWMVAPRNTFTGVTASNSTGVAGKGRLLYYQSATTSGAATWYPFSGRYNNTGLLATQGGTSWIWTSSFRHQTTYAATLFSMTSTAVATTNNYYAVWGASVRCVQQY